ncbi:MAG: polyprenyl synthetase family protein [Selenomonadaceae bacterium]|nr:polyprenyl synthetase family protein [Selenomonadaceae bacterium]MBQ3726969.1 polyprenyl synthetase family protein [Selenomonadaceae bacterium]MBQ9496872.1 polyprenyl synthetase family protein [Selenomonadaceae bacterium]
MNFVAALNDAAAKNLLVLEEHIRQSISDDPFIFEACAPLFKGGKRLRPMLFLLCANSKTNCPPEKTMPLATALELIHTASLVHDDIIDTSKKRRGVETANSKYGAQIAVLVGDYLFAKAFQLVAENNYGAQVQLILSKLVKNLCVGEIMQDRSLFEVPTMTEYYTHINLKTAIFLSSCCRLGGIVAEMDEREVENLTAYGSGLGLAFQIIDDLLDFFGDEKITGKPRGGDLKSGVITLPVIRALEVSDEAETLKKIVTGGGDVEAAIKIIQATDAVDYCRTRAEAHIDSARVNLPLTLKTSVALALEQVADFIVDRTR